MFAFAGAKGGTGKSTLATNFAIALMQEVQGRVALVDLDMGFCGDAALISGMTDVKRSLADIAPLVESLAPNMLCNFIDKHDSGMSILPAYIRMADRNKITPKSVGRTLELMSRAFDGVVVDLSSGFGAVNLACLAQSSHLFMVLTPDDLAIQHTKRGLEILQTHGFPRQMISIIVNKSNPKQSLSSSAVSSRLQRQVRATIPDDPVAFSNSVDQRTPLIVSHPRHKASRTIYDLAAEMWSIGLAAGKVELTGLDMEQMIDKADAPGKIDDRVQAAASINSSARKIVDDIKLRVHQRLLEEMDLKRMEDEVFNDPKEAAKLRQDAKQLIDRLLDEEGEAIKDRAKRNRISLEILNEALGLGPIEGLLQDESVTEIMANGSDIIFVERRGRLEQTGIHFLSEKHLRSTIERIVAPLGRRIDEQSPMVDARLTDGSRVNAIIPPLAVDGPLLTIRKFAKNALTISDLIDFGSLNEQMARFFDCCVKAKLNIVISGGTGSGKTSLLNVLSSYIAGDERIVTIEDSAELRLPQVHVCRLESRPPSLEGTGEIQIRDLVRNALRMRPDRIIVGECRGAESLDMLQAMNTGHDGSMTTVHANNPRDALRRLETLVMFAGFELPSRAIREQIVSAVNLVIQQSRLPDGSRKIVQIAELTGMEGDVITMQDIFTFSQTGLGPDGKIEGRFLASGFIPKFMNILEEKGFPAPREIFMESYT